MNSVKPPGLVYLEIGGDQQIACGKNMSEALTGSIGRLDEANFG